MSVTLPAAKVYEYFSNLCHGDKFITWENFQGIPDWNYPELDLTRLIEIFTQGEHYIRDKNVIDLGCHSGFYLYVAKQLGAKNVHGVNARLFPIRVGEYAFSQLGQSNYTFTHGDIEDLSLLSKVCKNQDTLIMTLTLEHLRNPYAIINTVTKSDIQNIIFETTVYDESLIPGLLYYRQNTDHLFNVYDNGKETAVGAIPNTAWIDLVFYELGWKIEYYNLRFNFNKNWFNNKSVGKNAPPATHKTACIIATKF